MTFKVGDRVRYLYKGGGIGERLGTIIIDRADSRVYRFRVDFEGGNVNYLNEENMQHYRVKNTMVARKMNKGSIEREEDGWLYLK